jgi:TonB family protein
MTFKKFFIYCLLSIPVLIFAQDTIYLDKKGRTVKSIALANVYKVILQDTIADSIFIEKEYTLSGQIKSERKYYEKDKIGSTSKSIFYEGLSVYWHGNGQIKAEKNYKKNQYDGILKTYWKNGQLKRKDLYELNKFVEGICYDSIGNQVEHYPYELMPQFPGGEKMLFMYLSRNVKYPVVAQENKIQGRVITQFVVDAEGKIVDLEVVRSVNWDLDAEALRVVRNMPNWIPGTQDGVKVRVKYTLPVNFRLQ